MAIQDGGKGSKPRPIEDREKYEAEMDRLFPRKRKDNVGYPPLTPNQPVESTNKDDWDEERIDIIGSNGNSGEHY